MSADLDNQPYDNVEFPIRGPQPGAAPAYRNPGLSPVQRGNLITGPMPGHKEKAGGYNGLAPVAELGGLAEEEEEETVKVEDPRQRVGGVGVGGGGGGGAMGLGVVTSSTSGASSAHDVGLLTTTASTSTKTTDNVITMPPRAPPKPNHVTPQPKVNQSQPSPDKHANKSDTFPRSMKPPPSPSRDSKSSFGGADQTKSPEDFTWGAFNPLSHEVFENAYTRHKYFYKFSDKVLRQGTKMKSTVWDVPGKPGETLSYEQLLQGVLVDGERLLLGGSWLYFQDVQFYEPECSKQIRPPLGEGRICLTNLRMLLLCAEVSSDANIAEYGDPSSKKDEGGYKLTVSKLNNVYFQNIPIDCFESVELSSSVGTMAESKLSRKKPACCGLFSCVGGLCGPSWKATPPIPINKVKRVVRLGVYLPPWRTPTVIIVNLHPRMSLTAARDFVSHLQNHVPQMQYHNKHGATVL